MKNCVGVGLAFDGVVQPVLNQPRIGLGRDRARRGGQPLINLAAKAAVPGVTMSTGVGKIVEPYLQSPCIAGNRKLQRLWDQRGYDAAGADAIEQTAPQDFAAGMEPGEGFDVPDLSAAPISTTAG